MSDKKILFIINPHSGDTSNNWENLITSYFICSKFVCDFFYISKETTEQTLHEKIQTILPDMLVAVGGDGTVRLAASCLIQKNIPLGILPAGSANGLAKEFGISENPEKALNIIKKGFLKKIHVTKINNIICIHLSDIGFNAYAMKHFEVQNKRGMFGYFLASCKVLFKNPVIHVEMRVDNTYIKVKAAMIVIANATKYSSGIIINPIGRLDDNLFEVIAVREISLGEIWKMLFSHAPYNLTKTEIFQTQSLSMKSKKKVYFQVDGEYQGKVNEVTGYLIKDALQIIVPAPLLK